MSQASERIEIKQDHFRASSEKPLTGRDWFHYIAPLFQACMDPSAPFPAGAGMTSWKIGDVVVGRAQVPTQNLVRDAAMVAQQELDYILVLFLEAGTLRLETQGRTNLAAAQQIVVLDLCQPVTIHAEAASVTAVFIPRQRVPAGHGDLAAIHGRTYDHHGISVRRLFYSYVGSLAELEDGILPCQIEGMSQAAATLCAACFPTVKDSRRMANADVVAAIRRYVQDQLLNPALDVNGIAERFGLSRAALYRLFSAEGGVVKYIRDHRLTKARQLLAQPGPAGRPRIAIVASATGFTAEKAFSRAFKKRFGHLPRDARSGATRRPLGGDHVSQLAHWLTTSAA